MNEKEKRYVSKSPCGALSAEDSADMGYGGPLQATSAHRRGEMIIMSRRRTTEGRFGFTPHRFLRGGFWQECSVTELMLHYLLSLTGNRFGVSFYGKEKLASLCKMSEQQLKQSREGLEAKDLIAFDGVSIQLLSLPQRPVITRKRWTYIPQQRKQQPQIRKKREDPFSVADALHAYVLKQKKRSK